VIESDREHLIDGEHDPHGRGARELVEAGVDLLDGRERRVIELRYFEGLDQAGIAERLGLTERQVALLTERAFVHMRDGIAAGAVGPGHGAHLERVLLRMEPVLHRRLTALADDEQIPLESFITNTLQRAVDDPMTLYPPAPEPPPADDRLLKANLVAVITAITVGLILVAIAIAQGW
jgi:hypothetical protein